VTPLDVLKQENARLRAENEELRDDLRHAYRQLGLEEDESLVLRLRSFLGVTHQQAVILSALYHARAPVGRLDLEAIIPRLDHTKECRGANFVSVRVAQLRNRIGRDKVATLYGRGYVLTPAGRAYVDRWRQTQAAAA
jgi:DNA-binding response OmpR family regulator